MSIQRTVAFRSDPDVLRPLARFRLEGATLVAEWLSDGYRRAVEAEGIRALPMGQPPCVVRLEDGERFFAALESAYTGSSRMAVFDEPLTIFIPVRS